MLTTVLVTGSSGAFAALFPYTPAPGVTEVVFELREEAFTLTPTLALGLSVLSRSMPVTIRGHGTTGYTWLDSKVPISFTLFSCQLTFERIKFEQIAPGAPALFALGDAANLTLNNCVAECHGGKFLVKAGRLGSVRATGLKVFGASRCIDVFNAVPELGVSAEVELVACGFGDAREAVRLTNILRARVEECVFQECDAGLRIRFDPGAAAAGDHAVTDSWFHDCSVGLILDDAASTFGAAPVNRGHTLGLEDGRSRRIVVERNEFRSPRRMTFPEPRDGRFADGAELPLPPHGWDIRRDETVGVWLSSYPPAPRGAAASTNLVTFRENVVHLCDTGLVVDVGPHAHVLVDHNTFVANPVRSVLLGHLVPGVGLGLAVTANLFIGSGVRADLAMPAGGTSAPPLGYRFAGVHILQAANLGMLSRAWVGRNVLQGISADAAVCTGDIAAPTPVTLWEAQSTLAPGGVQHVSWDNVRSGTALVSVLRLPRWRESRDGVVFLRYDYHVKQGTIGAPALAGRTYQEADCGTAGSLNAVAAPSSLSWLASGDERARWLESRGMPYPPMDLDFYRERIGYHRAAWPVGAARSVPSWQQFPMICWGFLSDQSGLDTGDYFDAYSPGRVYVPTGEPGSLAWDQVSVAFGSDLARAEARQMGIVVPVPTYACDGARSGCAASLSGLAGSTSFVGGVAPLLMHGTISIPMDNSAAAISEDYAAYWGARASAYVSGLAACDLNERIYMWALGDEIDVNVDSMSLVAFGRRVIAQSDPLRRGVGWSQEGWWSPMGHGLTTMTGAFPLNGTIGSAGTFALTNSLVLPSWAPQVQEIGFMELPLADRVFLGPVFSDGVNEAEATQSPGGYMSCLLEGSAPGGGFSRLGATACLDDWGVIRAQALDDRGAPAWTSDHAQSSWHAGRSLGQARVSSDRSFVHQRAHISLEQTEIAMRQASISLSQGPPGRLAFHNPGINHPTADPRDGGFHDDAVADIGHFRHDFWAGLHHAEGLWIYNVGFYDPDDPVSGTQWRATAQGLEIIRGTDPGGLGVGFRDALANGEKAQGLMLEARPPHWMPSLTVISTDLQGTGQRGRGFGRSGAVPTSRADLIWTAWRRGRYTWLAVSCSRTGDGSWTDEPSILRFDGTLSTTVQLTASTATVTAASGSVVEVEFNAIDAILLRIG